MSGRLRRIALFVAAIWLAMAALPALPNIVGTGLDNGWMTGLNLAHSQGLIHGKDIVWTYGPLGYLFVPDGSGRDLYRVLAFNLGVYALWCAALLRWCFIESRVKAWLVVLIGFSALLDPSGFTLQLAVLTWCLLILVDHSPWRDAGLFVVSFLAALECLIKINTGVECALLFAAVLLTLGLRDARTSQTLRWTIAGSALLLPVTMALLYAAESGTMAWFPAYLEHSFAIASGYSEAMGIDGPLSQAVIAVISSAVLFLVLPWLERPRRNLAAGYLPAVIYAFFSFKLAMVRQDGHAADFQLNLALAALFLLAIARTRTFLYATAIFQLVCVLVAHYYISEPGKWPFIDHIVLSRLGLTANLPAMKGYLKWPESWAGLEGAGRAISRPLCVGPELQSLIGKHTVEVLPWEVARVKANRWTWNPQPVFQSYAAYPASLDRMNADHLLSGRGADFAILSWDYIDNRHPFLETPLAWRTQLDLYQKVIEEGDMLVVGKRALPRFKTIQPLSSETAGWERDIQVPQSNDPVIMSAQVRLSILGSMRALLFRSRPVFVEVTRQSGKKEQYRALRANLVDGVIVNQFPAGLGDLALLASSGCSLSDPVVSFRFETPTPDDFEPEIPLAWARLVRRVEPQDDCVAIDREQASFQVWGGAGTLQLTAGAGVNWSALVNQPWLSVSPVSGAPGQSTLSFSVPENLHAQPRQADVRIAGHVLHIYQRGLEPAPGEQPAQLGFWGEGPFAGFSPPGSQAGDQPVMGDWTGSGLMRLGIFRDGQWYLDLNGNGQWDGVAGGDGVFSFGLPGDIAVPGDWTGDGKTRLGIFRKGAWAFDLNGNMAFDSHDRFVNFGLPGDLPVVGKWSRDRADHVGVFRHGAWIVDSNGDGAFELADERFTFGLAGDLPLVSFGTSNIGVLRKGDCLLAAKGARGPAPSLTVACKEHPLIGTW